MTEYEKLSGMISRLGELFRDFMDSDIQQFLQAINEEKDDLPEKERYRLIEFMNILSKSFSNLAGMVEKNLQIVDDGRDKTVN